MDRFTLRALAALLVCYDSEAEWTLTKLSAKLGIPRQAGSHALKRLASEGLIRRAPHPVDGRVTLLQLTPSGRALCSSLAKPSKTRFSPREVVHRGAPR
ncbi:MarR family transcriptional regulator [Acidisoma sp. S159]|uniref:MarR family transcriptional regulator n=1 Tax=Acidisoma sp. S159 TaxID=1747225 RepID=UPI00352B7444